MTNEQLQREIDILKREVATVRYLLSRKTGLGSADVKANLVAPSSVPTAALDNNSVTNAKMADDAIKQAELDYEQVSVTVLAAASTGTGTVTSGSIIFGWRATSNQDQFIDSIAVSGTTVTVTLAANATADNVFQITLLKS